MRKVTYNEPIKEESKEQPIAQIPRKRFKKPAAQARVNKQTQNSNSRAVNNMQRSAGLKQMNTAELLNEWDAMLVAKHFPGKYNVPYINNMNISSQFTGVLHTAGSFLTAYNTDAVPVSQNLGTQPYLVIMYCPQLSSYYSPGGSGTLPSDSKLAGFWMRQTANPAQDIVQAPNFWTVYQGGMSLSSIYGSQGDTIGESAMIWASKIKMDIELPVATISGAVSYGVTTYGSLTARDNASTISVNDLLRTSTRTVKFNSQRLSVELQSGVCNHDLASNMNCQIGMPNDSESQELNNEVVAYAIVHAPGRTIDSGSALTQFQMTYSINSNYVYSAKVWDAFARSLGDGSGSSHQSIFIRGGVIQRLINSPYNPLQYFPEPKKGTRLGDLFQKVKHAYTSNKSWIDPLANAAVARFAPGFLLAPQNHTQGEEDIQFLDVQLSLFKMHEILHLLANSPLASRFDLPQIKQDLLALKNTQELFVPYEDVFQSQTFTAVSAKRNKP